MKMSRTAQSIVRIRDRNPSLTLQKITEEEMTHFTKKRMTKIFGTFMILFATLYVMSAQIFTNKESTYTIKAGSFMIYVVFSLCSTLRASNVVQDIHKIKRHEHYDYDEADLHFEDPRVIKKLVVGCFLSGILSGILGIAGGTIMGPLFLSLKMIPEVVSATNQYIGMISSLSVTLQYVFKGKLNYGFLLLIGTFILLSSYLGLIQVAKLVKKTGRQSIIIFVMAFVFIVSFLILPVKYILQ